MYNIITGLREEDVRKNGKATRPHQDIYSEEKYLIMEKTTAKRVTKSQRFEDTIALLTGKPVQYGTTVAEAVAVLRKEQEQLAKKNSSDKKPTKTQEENEGYKALIIDFLSTQAEGVTVTIIQKGVPEFEGFNNQKVAALVRQLVEAGKVQKQVVKGKSLFLIA